MGRLIDADNAYRVLTVRYNHRTDTQHKALRESLDMIKTEKAIPVERIKTEIKKLKALDFKFATMTAELIEEMLKEWEEEQNDKRESNHTY